MMMLIGDENRYRVDLSKPIPISLPLHHNQEGPNAYGAAKPTFVPQEVGERQMSIEQGGVVNSFNLTINPHGNGTHTETYQHIQSIHQPINRTLRSYHFFSQLITIKPRNSGQSKIIDRGLLQDVNISDGVNALIIRTLPNTTEKRTKNYTHSNPPFMDPSAVDFIVARGIDHLLVDLPSIDPEIDGGALLAHHCFWQNNRSKHCTLTEMIFVPNHVKDGLYLLNLQIINIDLDVSPSHPVLYAVQQ